MRKVVVSYGVLVAIAGLGAVFGACISSNNTPGGTGADGGPFSSDSGGPVGDSSQPTGDSSQPPSDGGSGADSTLPASLDAGIFDPVTTINVAGSPTWLAYNPANQELYASLIVFNDGGGSHGAGIAVISGSPSALKTTIPEPGVDGGPTSPSIYGLAVDPGTNKVFGVDGTNLYVIDGTNDTVTQTIAAPATFEVVVDPTTHTLYTMAYPTVTLDGGGTGQVIVITAMSETGTTSATAVLSDLALATQFYILALEPTNHHLYVCGTSVPSNLAAVDTLDVSANLAEGTQQTFPGQLFGCIAGFGGGALITTTNQDAGAINFLDPAVLSMPGTFSPSSGATNPSGTAAGFLLGGEANGPNPSVMSLSAGGTLFLGPVTAGVLPTSSYLSLLATGAPLAGNTEQVFAALTPITSTTGYAAPQIFAGEATFK